MAAAGEAFVGFIASADLTVVGHGFLSSLWLLAYLAFVLHNHIAKNSHRFQYYTIFRHIKTFFTEGKLIRDSVVAKYATTADGGKHQVDKEVTTGQYVQKMHILRKKPELLQILQQFRWKLHTGSLLRITNDILII